MNLSEGVADKARASRVVRKLQKAEAQFRKTMYELDKVLTSESEVLALSVNLPKYLSYCSFKFFIILNFLLCLPF